MNTPLVINIDTGVISFRTAENAEQCNCRPISEKHAAMVREGKIEMKDLLYTIKRHMMSAADFDYEKYAEDRSKLNVRHSALVFEETKVVEDAKPEDYISDDEIGVGEQGNDEVEKAFDELMGKPQKTEKPAKVKSTTSGLEGLKGI